MEFLFKIYVPIYMTVYFFVALFLNTLLQYRKTGINPLTFGRKQESAHDYVGWWFKVVLILIYICGLTNLWISLDKIRILDNLTIQGLGLLLTIAALLFTIYAQRVMGTAWRIGIDEEVKTRLVTEGPFAYVRNPVFLGMIVTLLGIFFLVPNYLMAFLFILNYLLINIQARLEEEYLLKTHGTDYAHYKERTGRFLPRALRKEEGRV